METDKTLDRPMLGDGIVCGSDNSSGWHWAK